LRDTPLGAETGNAEAEKESTKTEAVERVPGEKRQIEVAHNDVSRL
jgi:hypothetical protein